MSVTAFNRARREAAKKKAKPVETVKAVEAEKEAPKTKKKATKKAK